MSRVNVSQKHGGHQTYEARDGTWWNLPSGGQQVVYADYSSGRGQNGAATAIVWGEHKHQQKRGELDVSFTHKKLLEKRYLRQTLSTTRKWARSKP